MSPTVEIPDSLVLAAIERAALHRADGEAAVPIWAITEHLSIPRRSRRVRARLAALEASGAIERSRRRSIAVWSLTNAGKRRLTRARRAGEIELPESPQHAKWRNARTLAEQEIERFHTEAIDAITDAMELVESESPSDALFAVAERLRGECWRLASATYCAHEWAEPDDATADVDDRLDTRERQLPRAEQVALVAMRSGRRNVINWDRGRA